MGCLSAWVEAPNYPGPAAAKCRASVDREQSTAIRDWAAAPDTSALVDPQVTSDRNDRFPRLSHDPHRTSTEFLIETSSLLRGVQGQFQYPEGMIVAVDHARSGHAHTLVVFAPGTHDELRETARCLVALGVHRTEVFIDVFMGVEDQGGARGDKVVPEGRVLIAVRLPATLRGNR